MTHEQETPLEIALRLASADPARRPEFYRLLLESQVFILSRSDGTAKTNRTLAAGEKISIQHWLRNDGSPVIPFFSSMAALQRAIAQETPYMAFAARALFEMTRGSPLVLNPKSPYGKELLPQEIEALLTNGVNHQAEQRVITQPTRVLLGQPANYPQKMVDSLTALLARQSKVKAAYLALMHDPAHDEKPCLVVGIEADGDMEQLIRDAGAVAADTAPNREPVDLLRIKRGDGGLSDYCLRSVKPFYERGWSGKLKSLLGIGST